MGSSKVNAPDAGQSGSAEQGLTALVTHGGPAPHLSTSREEGTGTRIPRRTPRLLIQHVESHSEICGFATKGTHFHQEVKFFSDILKIVFRVHLATNISSITSVRDSSKYADRAPKVSSFGFMASTCTSGRGKVAAACPRPTPCPVPVPRGRQCQGRPTAPGRPSWEPGCGALASQTGCEGGRAGGRERRRLRIQDFPPKFFRASSLNPRL